MSENKEKLQLIQVVLKELQTPTGSDVGSVYLTNRFINELIRSDIASEFHVDLGQFDRKKIINANEEYWKKEMEKCIASKEYFIETYCHVKENTSTAPSWDEFKESMKLLCTNPQEEQIIDLLVYRAKKIYNPPTRK